MSHKSNTGNRRLIFFRTLLWIGVLCILAALLVSVFTLSSANRTLKKQMQEQEQRITEQEEQIRQLTEELTARAERWAALPRTPVPQAKETGWKAWHDIYPELYAQRPAEWVEQTKTVFLTFDDGPTIYTGQVLDTLKEKGTKGTFFVVGRYEETDKALMRRIVEEGHTIAVHTDSHQYKQIYASVDAYLTDFYRIHQLIYEATGVKADIFRYPGGSINSYNKKIQREISNEMVRRGFTWYDWNASAGDSSARITKEAAYANAVSKAGAEDRIILLMHDTKKASVDALPDIIDYYREMGYEFAKLTNEDKPMAYNL